jgi:hypothetical protein
LKFHCYLVFRSLLSPEGHAVFGLQAIADLALALAWDWILGNVFLKEMVVISLRGWEGSFQQNRTRLNILMMFKIPTPIQKIGHGSAKIKLLHACLILGNLLTI